MIANLNRTMEEVSFDHHHHEELSIRIVENDDYDHLEDARSRAAYKEFGDVLTFDTAYLTNKYDIPFAAFVGVNHHGQSILFGCGLMSNEDTETYVWLFQSWLTCMFGCAPTAIITDQDKAMQKATLGATFVKDTFWDGMSTTQRSESMHTFFDGYVNSKTTLKQFVEQYENV
ncbi:hypothetical protein Ddye_019884 [Dipteronia dyeriana]|uniref:Protein FAR1-RELATED SEQUENCE n=1 Tax=Dipteronia dyeriana TaxID=168575 RepID=A0AAD9TZP0_9ROSI|nr:hypothetical protein Ddye_019884 [Dipteronia dyeriana]